MRRVSATFVTKSQDRPPMVGSALEDLFEALERGVGLAPGYAAGERARGHRAERAERRVELVLVLEPRAAVAVLRQALDDARLGARRALALPARVARRVDLAQRPMHVEVDTAQAQPLVHAEPRPELAGVVVLHAAVDRHPFAALGGIHDELPHLLRRRVDVDGGRDGSHRRATLSGGEW